MSGLVRGLVALAIALLIGGVRYLYETRILIPLVPDAQNGIWYFFSLLTSLFAAAVTFALCWAVLHRRAAATTAAPVRSSGVVTLALLAGLAMVVAWTARDLLRMATVRRALLDAADPGTPAERLRQLATLRIGPGYELDNRVARHPNTPPDVLRMLHGRPDQVGTEMCLAANPNTPADVLRALAERTDDWAELIRGHLRKNPRFAAGVSPDDSGPDERRVDGDADIDERRR